MIKQATVEDSPIISAIHAASWKQAYKGLIPQQYLDELKESFWEEAFNHWISNNLFTVQIAYSQQEAVGCIAYGPARDEAYDRWGEIVSVYVLPSHWQSGIGASLLSTALTDMKTQGFTSLYLWVLAENQRARKFYEKNNFTATNDEYTFSVLDKPLADIRYIMNFS